MMPDLQNDLSILLKELKLKGQLPKNIDISIVGNRFWVACYDENESDIISESSTTGFSEDRNIAILKALSENAERSAFRSGYKKQLTTCMTDRSDGFAAYPIFYKNAEALAHQAAYNEAVERYVWATWWDDVEIKFVMNELASFNAHTDIIKQVSIIKDQCAIDKIFVIQPEIGNEINLSVTILFGQLKSGGYISGGACGLSAEIDQSILKSLDELYRHGLAVKRMQDGNLKPNTFYEKRLSYFATGAGNHLIEKRIKATGIKSICLPNLQIDESVDHELSDLFYVHRCYFENQPAFVGGDLERLCL